jgi:ring-1,2-phenylacetyl-CoA epoxidase subunit PaaD
VRVVADAGPLHYLILTCEISLLPHLFETVVVPETVRSELAHARAPSLVRDWVASRPPWLDVVPTLPLETLPLPALDDGERAALALAPAWTTDWLTPTAHRKLAEAGIAPPRRGPPACPRCGAASETISEFGATACKALHRCLSRREPFEAFKCH